MDCGEESSGASRDGRAVAGNLALREAPHAAPAQTEPAHETAASSDFLASFARGRTDNDDAIEAFARAGLTDEIVAALGMLCEAPLAVVEHLLSLPGRETVHLLARAAGLDWRSARAIIELRAGNAVIAPHELERTRAHFLQLSPQTARRYLQVFRHTAGSA